jgi:hypothetical protein
MKITDSEHESTLNIVLSMCVFGGGGIKQETVVNLMFIGPRIIVIVEE